MSRLKNASLVLCLFVVLLVIFGSYFRANEIGTFVGALAGTPLLVHAFNRIAPNRVNRDPKKAERTDVVPRCDVPQPAEQVFVLGMERPNGRAET